MKSYQPDFIKPSVFDSEAISSWFTKRGESVQDNFKIRGLNLGFNTEEYEEIVKGNRNFLANSISTPISDIAFADQVHGNEIIEVQKGGIYENIDGFITTEKGLALAIQVADCAAVLFGDSKAGVISAVHAGWRGAEAEIVPKAIQKMVSLNADPKDIKVFISPCISQKQFEVGEEVAEKFPDEFVDRKSYSKPHIDIKKFIESQLLSAGILEENIEIHGSCTFSESDYYSYRRDGKRSGRMMGIIKLNETV
jgi:YfiH family protein